MANRLVGEVHERDVPDVPIDYVNIGLKAFGHRADISRVIALVRPVIDVVQLQLPELIPLVKNLLAAVWPGMARDVASNGVILIAVSVKDVQRLVGAKPDGVYGDSTGEAVRLWQIKNGTVLPDGWSGRDTIMAMGPELLKLKQ